MTLAGHVFDREGRPVTAPFSVTMALARDPATVIATATGTDGYYSIAVPGPEYELLITVRAEGYAPRERRNSGRRMYVLGTDRAATAFDFGGPANSADPDAPAFFLPPLGANGAVIPGSSVLEFEQSVVTTVAGDGTNEALAYPGGLAVGADGRILVTEASNHNRLALIAPDGRLSVLAGGPITEGYPNEIYLRDGQGTEARFYGPSDVAMDREGNAYVADTANSAIRKVTPAGNVTTLAGRRPYGYANGVGAQALFWGPTGVAVDSRRNVFVSDSGNFCIRKVTPAGVVTTFAGTNEPGYANGPGPQARFRSPGRLAIDAQDNLYVVDGGNHRIRKVSPEGVVSDAYGDPVTRPDGAVEMPALSDLSAIAVDERGNLYAATSERIHRITPEGKVTIVAGYGLWGYADGTAQTAYFAGIAGLTIDAKGQLYVTEAGNNRVRKIVLGP